MSRDVLATTTPGLEQVALDEIRELTGREGWVEHPGLVGLDGSDDELARLNRFARSLYRVHWILLRGEHGGLDGVYERLRELDYGELLAAGQSLAVKVARQGEHAFTSQDVGRVAGQAIIDACRARTGARPPVDLDAPDVIFRIEVRDERFWLALDTTGLRSLAERPYRVYAHPAALRAPIAYALVRLSGWRADEGLLDPMCGSATILLEAAAWARGFVHPGPFALERYRWFDTERLARVAPPAPSPSGPLDLRGYEIRRGPLEGARRNAQAAGVELAIEPADATRAPLDADRVVVNVPYGIRMGSPRKIAALYDAFARNLRRGEWRRLVVITARPQMFRNALALEPAREIDVLNGGLYTRVLVYDSAD